MSLGAHICRVDAMRSLVSPVSSAWTRALAMNQDPAHARMNRVIRCASFAMRESSKRPLPPLGSLKMTSVFPCFCHRAMERESAAPMRISFDCRTYFTTAKHDLPEAAGPVSFG